MFWVLENTRLHMRYVRSSYLWRRLCRKPTDWWVLRLGTRSFHIKCITWDCLYKMSCFHSNCSRERHIAKRSFPCSDRVGHDSSGWVFSRGVQKERHSSSSRRENYAIYFGFSVFISVTVPSSLLTLMTSFNMRLKVPLRKIAATTS